MFSSDRLLTFQWQSSGDSYPSKPSDSDVSLQESPKNVQLDTKLQGKSALDKAKSQTVAFAVRTNIHFDGRNADDAPIAKSAIRFDVNDYLHIIENYNQDWWIGRVVKEGCDLAFVPSPSKLEKIRRTQCKGKGLIKSTPSTSVDNDDEGDGEANPLQKSGQSKEGRKKQQDSNVPYVVVPSMRPVILCGPSLKGYEVTDMMQKAIFDFIKQRFKDRVSIIRVTADISLAKRSDLNNLGKREKLNVQSQLAEVQNEINRIFEIAKSLNLIVLDADTINHPNQLTKTSLAPIVVALKISSPKVLQRLIKSRGKTQSRSLNSQMAAAEKLAQCNQELLDVVLDESQLDNACEHLAEFLEAYWRATHPLFKSRKPAPEYNRTGSPSSTNVGVV